MSKRVQLILALVGLFLASSMLGTLLILIMLREKVEVPQEQVTVQVVTESSRTQEEDPWANREDEARRLVQGRHSTAEASETRRTIRQVVETALIRSTFSDLFWGRIERIGWRFFQLENSVYEAQFLYRDYGVEFGPAWIVQTDPSGLMPPGSGGVVPANIFAEVVQKGAPAEVSRYFNREEEVVQALTNHQFAGGARLTSAILVYFNERRQQVDSWQLLGWTVVPERIQPGRGNFYRAYFQWMEDERNLFAQWEVNIDNYQFRGLNLLASDIMTTGDTINRVQIVDIRPSNLDELERANPRGARLFQAARMIVDNDRLVEAISSLLWHLDRLGVEITYPSPVTRWDLAPTPDMDRVYDVSYPYGADGIDTAVRFRVDLNANTIEPRCELSALVYTTLNYVDTVDLSDILPPPPTEGPPRSEVNGEEGRDSDQAQPGEGEPDGQPQEDDPTTAAEQEGEAVEND